MSARIRGWEFNPEHSEYRLQVLTTAMNPIVTRSGDVKGTVLNFTVEV
jgi:hypothetical protein